ncbi:MAG: cupin-like domain-containing protein, partial [Comamonas sp.]
LPDAVALPAPAENPARETQEPTDDARAAPSFTDDWRSWIAENLALGAAVDALLPTLVEHGFHVGEAQRELDKAARSPYLPPARRLAQRVLKREWVLEAQRKLRPPQSAIERRHRLPRDTFLREYYSANRPVIITGMMDDWPARNWTPAQLAAQFFDQQVQVQAGRNANVRYEMEGAKHKKMMRFGDFMQQVMHGGPSNDIYMTANNVGANAQAMAGLWDGIVQIPEYLDAGNPANRGFFWIGPAGTVTPTHHDLTNNFMAQIMGRKRVRLVDSLQAARIHNSLHVYSDVDLETIDYARFPAMRAVTVLECDLAPGELLFIPVGWWHHVRSLDISVTVTFVNFVFDNDFSSMYTTYQAV